MPTTTTKVLSCFLFTCLIFNVIEMIDGDAASPVMHSGFLRAVVRGRRGRPCFDDKSVCLLYMENRPWQENYTCCFHRFCKDVLNDEQHCGECGHKCGFGLACCGGRCTTLESDPLHCGSCYHVCPQKVECSFGLCGYGGGDL
ncbi:putative stigma-specific protein Stig1 [Dioscorea sansibarensis]